MKIENCFLLPLLREPHIRKISKVGNQIAKLL